MLSWLNSSGRLSSLSVSGLDRRLPADADQAFGGVNIHPSFGHRRRAVRDLAQRVSASHLASDNTAANLLTPPRGINLVSKADTLRQNEQSPVGKTDHH